MDDDDLNLREGLGALSEETTESAASEKRRYVVEQLTKEAEEIDLSGTNLGDQFINDLVDLFAEHGAHAVTHLDLQSTGMTDIGLSTLCEALIFGKEGCLERVASVNLMGNQITDAS